MLAIVLDFIFRNGLLTAFFLFLLVKQTEKKMKQIEKELAEIKSKLMKK